MMMSHRSNAAAQLAKPQLQEAINRLPLGKVLVVGDMAIDEMVYGTVDRLSREAPVIILRHSHTQCLLGAAANAAHNVASLGAQVTAVGVMGNDYNAQQLHQAFLRDGVDPSGMQVDADRPTTTKSRLSGTVSQSVTQQLVRIDRESRQPVSAALEQSLIQWLENHIAQYDALLLSDYGLGVVTPNMIAACRRLTQQHGLRWAVDSQQPLTAFAGADVVTPNLPEAEKNLNRALDDDEALTTGIQQLKSQCGVRNALITRGQDGMLLHTEDGALWFIPVFNRSEVFDVTGAGDTVVATLLVAWSTGATLQQAAVLGNLAASLVVRHYGAATTTPAELTVALDALPDDLLAGVQYQQATRTDVLPCERERQPI